MRWMEVMIWSDAPQNQGLEAIIFQINISTRACVDRLAIRDRRLLFRRTRAILIGLLLVFFSNPIPVAIFFRSTTEVLSSVLYAVRAAAGVRNYHFSACLPARPHSEATLPEARWRSAGK